MPTGLKTNNLSFAKMGNINIQAIKSQSEDNKNGALNIQGAAVIGYNKIVGPQNGNISQNASKQVVPFINEFQNLQITLPKLTIPIKLDYKKSDKLVISPILSKYFIPIKLKGISEQRPEIISLTDFSSIYATNGSVQSSDSGEFIKTSIAARKMRLDHIRALISSIQEVEGSNKILQEIAENYSAEVLEAENVVKLMTKISRTVENIKNSLNVRKSENFTDEKINKDIVSAKSYKEFLVELYGFSDSGVDNFSNTKLIGQFLLDARTTLAEYSPSLFGSSNVSSPNAINAGKGFQINQPKLNENFFNANFGLQQNQAGIQRRADRDFGSYNSGEFDISDGQFTFKVKSFRNLPYPILGTAFNQFLDSLPGNASDRAALLLTTLSKEMRISSGLGNESIKSVLIDKLGGSETGDPFEIIIGSPGDDITDVPNGENSLCSLLRFKNNSNEVVLPFESSYVRGENGVLYIPGSKEFGDSILQSEIPYDISNIKLYQEKMSEISGDAISLIGKILKEKTLKPENLLEDISRNFSEAIDAILGITIENNLSGEWGELSLIKAAFSNRELKHLLFQYVLVLGLIGTPGIGDIGTSNVESFFRDMSFFEIKNWGNLPSISQNKNLNNNTVEKLNSIFKNFLGIEEEVDSNIETNDVSNSPTTDHLAGYTVLSFLVDSIIGKIDTQGAPNINNVNGGNITIDHLTGHLISNRNLILLNKMADFISTIANRAGSFTDENNRTRNNGLSYTAISVFAFEAFMSVLEPLLSGISEPTTNGEVFTISSNIDELIKSQDIVKTFLTNLNLKTVAINNNSQISQSQNIQEASLSSTGKLRTKLQKEETIISQIVSRIRRTFGLIESVTADAVDFFAQNSPNAQGLANLIDSQGGKERIALLNEAQFILSRKALSDFNEGQGLSLITKNVYKSPSKNKNPETRVYLTKVEVPVFLEGTEIGTNEKILMETILNRPKFKGSRSENLKILTIGIPAGFSNNLSTEIGITEDTPNEIINKQRDVISINVYRRSIEFEDVVFKPRSYIFELSRFVTKSSVNREEVTQSKFFEFLNDRSIEFTKDFGANSTEDYQSRESFINNEEYSFLSNAQKKELAINHIESFVLGLYLQLLLGISTDENDYLINNELLDGFVSDESRNRFNDLVLTYVQGITQLPITIQQLKNSSPQIKSLLEKIDTFALNASFTEQITPPILPGVAIDQRIELTEDLINFVKLFTPKSLLTGGKIHSLRITSPKIFERIFNLAVDPDDFEIDLEKTFETTSGAKMYGVLEKKKMLTTSNGKVKIKERSKNNTISLDQFFVTISTVEEESQ